MKDERIEVAADALDYVRVALVSAHDTLASIERVLPSKKLIEHSKWQRTLLQKALALLPGKEEPHA